MVEQRIGSITNEQLCKQILQVLDEQGSGILRYKKREENGATILDVYTEEA